MLSFLWNCFTSFSYPTSQAARPEQTCTDLCSLCVFVLFISSCCCLPLNAGRLRQTADQVRRGGEHHRSSPSGSQGSPSEDPKHRFSTGAGIVLVNNEARMICHCSHFQDKLNI